jgi:hypothetical protein
MGTSQMSPTMSKTMVRPSGDTSGESHVPSSVVKLILRVAPRGLVTSQGEASAGVCA